MIIFEAQTSSGKPFAGPLFLLVAAFLTFTALTAEMSFTEPSDAHTAQIDGNRVAYRVLGQGRPVLVLISGLGDGMASFKDVVPELAKVATCRSATSL